MSSTLNTNLAIVNQVLGEKRMISLGFSAVRAKSLDGLVTGVQVMSCQREDGIMLLNYG